MQSIKAALRRTSTAKFARYLLILGGDDIVPFFRLPDRTPSAFLRVGGMDNAS
jgi:hypothetical protein